MRKIIMVVSSLFLALMLSILPLPANILPWNPAWALVTLFFWNYYYPRAVTLGVAWCVGLLLDGLNDSIIGLHALSCVLAIFIFDLFYRRFHMFHPLQQSLVVGFFVFIYSLVILSLNAMFMDQVVNWSILLSAITSIFCWPFYVILGRKLPLPRI